MAEQTNPVELLEASIDNGELDINVLITYLNQGGDPNYIDEEKGTLLRFCIIYGRSDMVQLLIERGANVNLRDNFGTTPLHVACGSNKPDIVNLLLDAGADINAFDNDNESTATPIFLVEGNYELIKLLIRRGANVNLKNNNGDTILDWWMTGIARADNSEDIIKLLKDGQYLMDFFTEIHSEKAVEIMNILYKNDIDIFDIHRDLIEKFGEENFKKFFKRIELKFKLLSPEKKTRFCKT